MDISQNCCDLCLCKAWKAWGYPSYGTCNEEDVDEPKGHRVVTPLDFPAGCLGLKCLKNTIKLVALGGRLNLESLWDTNDVQVPNPYVYIYIYIHIFMCFNICIYIYVYVYV